MAVLPNDLPPWERSISKVADGWMQAASRLWSGTYPPHHPRGASASGPAQRRGDERTNAAVELQTTGHTVQLA